MSTTVTAAISDAVAELERLFGPVDVEPDETGGAYVTVRELDLGERWAPQVLPLTFQLAYNYPYSAVYPFYCPGGLQRVDGAASPSALQPVTWRDRQVVQISLRASRWSPVHDSAAGVVAQVRRFFRDVA